MKNPSDTIGNRTRDFPAYSAVPQPTAPRVPLRLLSRNHKPGNDSLPHLTKNYYNLDLKNR